jgi:sRNA-binding protein
MRPFAPAMRPMSDATTPSHDTAPAPLASSADHDPAAAPAPEAVGPAPDVPTAPAPPMSPVECGRKLAELFPALFAGAPRPLKLRVHVDIQARAPGVFTRAALAAFMRRHTGSHAYLQAVARGTQRFGLDGEPAGDISAEHRQVALDELARRRARHAEKLAQEAQARRERQSLLRDYERTSLTEANFCALKGIRPDELPALLEQARREASEATTHPPRHAPRADAPHRPPARHREPRRDAGAPAARPPKPRRG